jgi:hypothetical protein
MQNPGPFCILRPCTQRTIAFLKGSFSPTKPVFRDDFVAWLSRGCAIGERDQLRGIGVTVATSPALLLERGIGKAR